MRFLCLFDLNLKKNAVYKKDLYYIMTKDSKTEKTHKLFYKNILLHRTPLEKC